MKTDFLVRITADLTEVFVALRDIQEKARDLDMRFNYWLDLTEEEHEVFV